MNPIKQIEVAYATPASQVIIQLDFMPEISAEQAIRQSGILERFPEIDLKQQKVGVFGRLVPLSHILMQGDRVEIYRPLIADPKQARRQRAQKQRVESA